VKESRAVSDHGSQRDRFGHVRDGKLDGNHFPHRQLAGRDGPQSSLGKLEAATVDPDISMPIEHLQNQRQFRAIPDEAPGMGLTGASKAWKTIPAQLL